MQFSVNPPYMVWGDMVWGDMVWGDMVWGDMVWGDTPLLYMCVNSSCTPLYPCPAHSVRVEHGITTCTNTDIFKGPYENLSRKQHIYIIMVVVVVWGGVVVVVALCR